MTIHSFFSDTPIVPLFVLGVIATLFGLWDQSRQPKPLHISAHRVNPELDAKRFYAIAQTVKIEDPEVRKVWDHVMRLAIQPTCTLSHEGILEMLDALDGGSGRIGFNDDVLDDDEDHPGRAQFFTASTPLSPLSCSKEGLLAAYHDLVKNLQSDNAHVISLSDWRANTEGIKPR